MAAHSDEEFDNLLDDALDEYSKATVPTVPAATTLKKEEPVKSKKPDTSENDISKALLESLNLGGNDELSDIFTKEFAEQLKKNMGDLFAGGMDEQQLNKGMESMLADIAALGEKMDTPVEKLDQKTPMGPVPPPPPAATTSAKKSASTSPIRSAKPVKPTSLQDKIQNTVDMMNENDRASDEKASTLLENNFISGLIDQNLDLDNLLDDKELEEMLQQVMKEMSSKEILYEPMTKLLIEYPKFFETKGGITSAEDMARYKKQHENIAKLVQLFDQPDHDSEPVKAKIAQLLEKTQELGEPPQEILSAISPNFDESATNPSPGIGQEQCSIM